MFLVLPLRPFNSANHDHRLISSATDPTLTLAISTSASRRRPYQCHVIPHITKAPAMANSSSPSGKCPAHATVFDRAPRTIASSATCSSERMRKYLTFRMIETKPIHPNPSEIHWKPEANPSFSYEMQRASSRRMNPEVLHFSSCFG